MEPYLYLLRRSYPFQDFVYNFLDPNLKLQPGQEIKSADSMSPLFAHTNLVMLGRLNLKCFEVFWSDVIKYS